MKLKIAFLFLAMFIHSLSYSQRIKNSKGQASVKIEDDITRNETKEKARKLAMINAIENEFGTYVEQETDITIIDGKASFNIIGNTKVKGEWIKTLNENFSELSRQEKINGVNKIEVYISCEISGKVRRLQPKVVVDFEILNCPQLECRTRTFLSNEQLYLFFKSPLKGYLSVFVIEGNITRRILPYSNVSDKNNSGVEINSDQEYLFFSPQNNTIEGSNVDEMIFYTNQKKENNTIVLVFSEEPFKKPILAKSESKGNLILPKSLSSKKFNEWLVDNRSLEYSFQYEKISIEIINVD